MKVLEGEKLKSKLTGMIYEVKKIEDKSVVLESRDELEKLALALACPYEILQVL